MISNNSVAPWIGGAYLARAADRLIRWFNNTKRNAFTGWGPSKIPRPILCISNIF
jgi:hypothetical protein